MKYFNEYRAGFGSAVRLNPDTQEREGVVLPPFVYSEKILEYVGKYEALMEEQRKYVRSLKAPYHEIWYPNIKRKPGEIFETDPVHMLGGIGKPSSAGDLSAKESFFHLLGLKTVADVKLKGALQSCTNVADVRQFVTDTLPPDTVPAKKKKFFSTDFLKCLLKAKTQGADSLEGSPPSPSIDYRKLHVGECPYVAKYGEVEGLLKLKVDVKKKKTPAIFVITVFTWLKLPEKLMLAQQKLNPSVFTMTHCSNLPTLNALHGYYYFALHIIPSSFLMLLFYFTYIIFIH